MINYTASRGNLINAHHVRQSLLDHLQVLVRVNRRLIKWNAGLNVLLAHNWNIGYHTALGWWEKEKEREESGLLTWTSTEINGIEYDQ